MLFNSYSFILCFLPVVLYGYFRLGKHSHALASLWLAAASLLFYGWWDVRYVGLLLGSIVFNYGAGYLIGHGVARQSAGRVRTLLAFGIAINLALLGYFKYANFIAGNINDLVGSSLIIGKVVLPLGISFFTFTQIAFLVDTSRGKVKEYDFVHYALFVTYFPHLIAGPVLHHKEIMPQFAKRNVCRINGDNVAAGLSIFVLGLSKKVLIADSLAGYSTPVFSAVSSGSNPMFFAAWVGALSYAFQLYFDFSAYSDMAVGLSLMFNVHLPMNFNSPYKATSIIEFWRRWHMTLSQFLRDYLYIPLGGNRHGKAQRMINLMITMLLGGLWHGASWTFVIWGGLHGLYLVANNGWRGIKNQLGWAGGGRLATAGSGVLTFLAVVIGWVFFRADSIPAAISVLRGMAGLNGVSLAVEFEGLLNNHAAANAGIVFGKGMFDPGEAVQVLGLGGGIAWLLPNVRQLFHAWRPAGENTEGDRLILKAGASSIFSGFLSLLKWEATTSQAACYGIAFCILMLFLRTVGVSEFLYFQF